MNCSLNESAGLITLCIGANDIMDAAPSTFFGRDFYGVIWTTADQGLDNIEAYCDDLINQIYVLNPNVELIVMNMYNPYKVSDPTVNSISHIKYPEASMHELVNKYFYNTEDLDLDGSIDYGLNYVIEYPEIVYPDFRHSYKVVNIYGDFERYQSNKGDYVAFYDNYVWSINVQDPHPTFMGQKRISELHFMSYNQ